MFPDLVTTPVSKTELKDYIDCIRHRLESLDQPLLKAKYMPESIASVKKCIQQQLRSLDMYEKNNFVIYRNVFESIKIIISDSFRTLRSIR